MKRTFTIICMVFMLSLVSKEAFAQPAHAFSFRQNFYNYLTPKADDCKWTDVFEKAEGRGVELAYYRKLEHNTYLVFPVKFGAAKFDDGKFTRRDLFGNLDVLVQRNFFKYGNFMNPYINFGAGSHYNVDQDCGAFNIPMSLGLNIKLLDDFYLNCQSQYRVSSRGDDGWHHGVGIVVFWGGSEKTPPPPPPAPDRDGDGINDDVDRCPDVYGLAALSGCPDKDGDNVADIDDKCPDVAGFAALMGCPDTDGDGIADNDDACPREKGTIAFKGCPDTDGDGLADKDDKCPREAGPASNMGCPIKEKDTDGDGILDKDDACPEKKGEAKYKGCPDTDGDGVADNVDKCVDKPGPASNQGCPEIKKEDKEKLSFAIKNVQFETGKATLLAKSLPVLDEVAGLMMKYPEYSLTISGHTDNVGDAAANQSLSERRAKACYDYLATKSVGAQRMSHAGYGETQPVGDNKTKAGRDLNRRVDFNMYLK